MPPSASNEPVSRSNLHRFLIDENVAPQVAAFLRDRGLDVLDTKEEGWFGKTDQELLEIAHQEDRVIITYDADFASIRRLNRPHPGIILVRLRNLRTQVVTAALEAFLTSYAERNLRDTLAVIEESRVRFRKTS